MSDVMVQYDGRYVPKKGFRTFIYGFDNTVKLVNSWEEYEQDMCSGLWFAKASDVPANLKSKKKGGE